ncbi:MAG TPA: phosphohistidine phosphatase SixA [Gemmatimonadales bacterium]|nr:phosphohistidine phosphatase SixA [Gemmatimonadales bacterium]
MRLVLLRHAHAGDRDPTRYPDDAERPLTAKGRKIQARTSRALKKLGVRCDLVLTSPWRRAAETAAILADALGLEAPRVSDALAAPPDLDRLGRDLADVDPGATVVLVGHEPWLGELGSLLLAGGTDRLAIDFPKSGLLCLELERLEPGAARLRWFLRPKLL